MDLSHWHSSALTEGEGAEEVLQLIGLAKKYKIGVNHISAIKAKSIVTHDRFRNQDFYGYDSHWLDDLSEVDYVKKYSDYLADIISLELENSLTRQLEVKKYLETILEI